MVEYSKFALKKQSWLEWWGKVLSRFVVSIRIGNQCLTLDPLKKGKIPKTWTFLRLSIGKCYETESWGQARVFRILDNQFKLGNPEKSAWSQKMKQVRKAKMPELEMGKTDGMRRQRGRSWAGTARKNAHVWAVETWFRRMHFANTFIWLLLSFCLWLGEL